ncbi:MAG: hypothetical protein JWN86_4618 [Planctomycetota bacterium]|nr:hypothetical protein [Planctomycetota bacterium]
MSKFTPRWTYSIAIASLVGLASAFATKSANAQLYSTDPYDPYGRPFRSFVYPGASDGPYGPGAGPVRRATAPNQFDRLGDDLVFSGGSRGGRYDGAYRRFDEEFGRNYVPNEQADAQYIKDREKREQDMIRAMRERDPKRRADILKDVNAESKRVESDLGVSVRRGAATGPISRAPSRRAVPAAGAAAPPTRAPGSATSRSRASADVPKRAAATVPPAPPSGRKARELEDARPSDVLERNQRIDRARAPITSPRRTSTPPSSAPRS